MFKNIFMKTLYEKRWFTVAWIFGLFSMALLTMIFYPYFTNSGFEQVVASAPKSLQSLLGDAAAYKTVSGYVDQQIFALRMPMLTLIMAISLFMSIGVGDEDRGTLESLLAQPVSRTKVYVHKLAAGAVICAIACAAIWLGVWASFPLVHGSMGLINLTQATIGCWIITLVFGTLAFACGTATGRKGLTIGLASGLAFISYLVTSLAPAVDKLSIVQKFSVFYYYNTPSITQNGLKPANVGILVGIMAVLTAGSLVIFRQRDLRRD